MSQEISDKWFSTFIFSSLLAPENSVQNKEKKSSYNFYDVLKYLGVATGDYDDFTLNFIIFLLLL